MGRFFGRYGLVFLLWQCAAQNLFAQVLDNAAINLNPGGYINDVVYDPYHDCYIVVGKFTSINSISRVNMACLDRATLAVETLPYLVPLESTNGEIRTVAITRTFSPGFYTYHLVIGGNFNTVTVSGVNQTRNGIAKLIATQTLVLPITHSNYSLSAWNADLDMTPLLTGVSAEGVDDLLITGDTILFSGRFWAVNNSSTYDLRDGLAAYSLTGTLLAYPAIASSGTYNSSRFYALQKEGGNLYLGGYVNGVGLGNGRLFKLDASGTPIGSFSYPSSTVRAVYGIEFLEDSLLCITADYASENNAPDGFYVVRESNGSLKANHSLSPFSNGMIGNAATGVTAMSLYKSSVFVATTQPAKHVVGVESAGEGPFVAALSWNANAPAALTTSVFGNVHVAGNKLFVSAPNITTLSGQARTGLGAYCLEPQDAGAFTLYDTTVCPEDSLVYAILPVTYADGYRWQYTGNGADLGANGSLDTGPYDVLTNSISIEFSAAFTPGQLSVTPYTLCNGLTKIFSDPVILDIKSNPLPHVDAGPDTSLTCARDSVVLFGYSDSVVVSYEWIYPFPDPAVAGQYDTVTAAGNYVFKVKNALGCPNFDTVHVVMDTLKPSVVLPSGTYDLTCAVPQKSFTGTSPTPHTTLQWFEPINAVFLPNPVTIGLPGTYYLVATDTLNGCSKSAGMLVYTNFIIPDIAIAGYPVLNSALPLDTLTCDSDTLVLTTYSVTPNSTVDWMAPDTSAFYGSTLAITEGGFYYLFATESTTGCTNSAGIAILDYQNALDAQAPETALLNCSADSVVLHGYSLNADVAKEWTGSLISPSPDPLVVYAPGVYYFTTTDALTGCTGTDSVLVLQDHSITLSAGNDTLVCTNASVPVQVVYAGNPGGISYLWNNGSTAATATYTAGAEPYAAVELFGDNGCYGADTVYLQVAPVPVMTFTGFKPCDDGPSGFIVAAPVSGLEPFTYSLDGGISFQTSPVFSALSVGTYPVVVKDSLGCTADFSAQIDENSSLPTPAFLLSTYNFTSDTVAIVDVSNPPADSVVWLFPPALTVLDANPFHPLIVLPDTGAFSITMQAYYGNCLVEISKVIYASPDDSLHATAYNLNGIKSVQLYPNPTSGNFTVTVEFYTAQRATLAVQDMIGTTYVFATYDESLLITAPVSLDSAVIDGTYGVKISSEFDSAFITFILAR